MGGAPFATGESAVAVPVSAAEPLVSSYRARLDSSAAYGIPAHVTVLYPFLPAPLLTSAVLDQVRGELGCVPPLEVAFQRLGRLGRVLYLAPEPAEPFEQLTARFARRWPEAPPYGGVHEKVIAHLTVAGSGSDGLLESIAGELATRLPLRTTLDEAALYLLAAGAGRCAGASA